MAPRRQSLSHKARHAQHAKVRAEIAKTAYQLYERRGRTPGGELQDWLKAERIVQERWSTPPED
ncbi:MAG: DUF2934 domain-containing protein [Candidatus Omnitrophica bacterium]|nr:DUF2934 domain-containing protein [Candidatus Omnitrophota bacterium]